MRTIEESIAVLEKWREAKPFRHFGFDSPRKGEKGMCRYASVCLTCYQDDTRYYDGDTLEEALDRAASEVEG